MSKLTLIAKKNRERERDRKESLGIKAQGSMIYCHLSMGNCCCASANRRLRCRFVYQQQWWWQRKSGATTTAFSARRTFQFTFFGNTLTYPTCFNCSQTAEQDDAKNSWIDWKCSQLSTNIWFNCDSRERRKKRESSTLIEFVLCVLLQCFAFSRFFFLSLLLLIVYLRPLRLIFIWFNFIYSVRLSLMIFVRSSLDSHVFTGRMPWTGTSDIWKCRIRTETLWER